MKKVITSVSLFLLPALVSAQQFGELDTFFERIIGFINNILIPVIFAVALLFFLWGAFMYFIKGGKGFDEAKEEGKQYMIWSIAGFVLMVSLWGIVNFLAGSLGFDNQELDNIPTTPSTRTSSGGLGGN